MNKAIQKSISNFFIEKPKIVLGLSGGPDSVALAHVLFSLKNHGFIKDLVFVHANFHLRGEESDADQRFCEDLALHLQTKIICRSFLIDKASAHIQKKARDFRRKFLLETATEIQGVVTLAHHHDDLIETILFRLFRGANLKTILPFEEFDGSTWRPFYGLKKSEVIEYLTTNKIDSRVDSSNLKTDYTRNILRLQIIPAITNQFPQAQSKILELVTSLNSVVEAISPPAIEVGNVIMIPEKIPTAILKIWIYEHIQKRLAVFHPVSDVILQDLAINKEAFVNISDNFSVRRTLNKLQFM